MAVTDLVIKVVADTASAKAGLSDSEAQTSKWAGGLNKAAGVAKVGLLALGGVMVAGAKAAADDAQAQAVLANSLKNAAGATDAQVASTEAWISKMALATGISDDQLRPALGALVRATGDVGEAQKAAALAMDISTATGKDLQSVSEALGKAYGGNTASLGKLVPSIDKATLASGDMTAISAALASQVGGATAASADTAAGQFQIFQVALDETKEGIGAALLPVLKQLSTRMADVSKWAANNTGTLTVLIAVVGSLMAITIAVNAVTKAFAAVQAIVRAATIAWTIAQKALNFALAANPIGLVIVAVALLAAGLVFAWKNSATFREIVTGSFNAVKAAAQACWDAVKNGINTAVAVMRAAWSGVEAMLVAPFRAAWSTISGIISQIKSAVNAVIDLIHKIPTPKIPHIPGLGRTAPATATATGYRTIHPGVARAPATTATGGGRTVINIHGAVDPEGTARQIRRILDGHDRRMGLTTA